MGLMPRELASYEVDFEQLIFRNILVIYLQDEVWDACIQDKTHGQL
jgi:hypothetical protein